MEQLRMKKYLIKFTSKKEYAEDLLAGKLFMRPARYYHDLPLGQGDEREGWLVSFAKIYFNINHPIYCMYCAQDCDIRDQKIYVDKRCIEDFHCEDGYAVIFPYDAFERVLPTLLVGNYYLNGGLVTYGQPDEKCLPELVNASKPVNLLIKHPRFSYQKEYRLVTGEVLESDPVPTDFKEYFFPHSLAGIGRIVSVANCQRVDGYYVFSTEEDA